MEVRVEVGIRGHPCQELHQLQELVLADVAAPFDGHALEVLPAQADALNSRKELHQVVGGDHVNGCVASAAPPHTRKERLRTCCLL
eukprot:5650472-Prorocentrum_lima.AAC.1